MDYEVRVEKVLPRQLAAVRGATSRAELPRTILKLLDTVWPVLRGQKVKTGHNVVLYFGGLAHIEAGVEVFGDFVDVGDVHHSQTPAGPAAMAAMAAHTGTSTAPTTPTVSGTSTSVTPSAFLTISRRTFPS